MKKLIAMLLALMLVLVSVAAMADDAKIVDPTKPVTQATPTTPIVITKSYTLEGSEDAVLPAHTITFEQESKKVGNATIMQNGEKKSVLSTTEVIDADVPDVTITLNDGNFTNGQKVFENNLTINLPSYSNAGVYDYVFAEVDGGVAGVEYFTDKLHLSVTVIETAGAGQPSSLKIGGVALRRGDKTEKIDNIENVYSANNLTVSKTVTGNLGDYDKDWNFTVELTAPAGDTVYSEITTTAAVKEIVEAGEGEGESEEEVEEVEEEEDLGITTIAPGATGWTGTRKFTFSLKHGQSLTFKNLPVQVTYKVTEAEANQDGYTTTPTDDAGSIVKESASTAAFVNNKEIVIDTGITLETLPYVMLMALAALGFVALKLRKREEY